jgi:PAS domain S-box-containing protein
MDTTQTLKLAIDHMSEGVQILDADWRYLYLNRAAELHGRAEADSLLGRTMPECYPGIEETLLWRDLCYVKQSGESRRIENEFIYPDGERRWFELHIESHPRGLLIRSLDISDRKLIEQQLRHAQRTETISRMAASIAHDFNNKLGIIMLSAQLVRETIADQFPESASQLTYAIAAARSAAEQVQRLLGLSRKQLLAPRVVELARFLDALKGQVGLLLGSKYSIETHCPESGTQLYVDPSALEDALLNLCINARDAMPGGGRILVRVRNTTLDEEYARNHAGVTPGPFVLIEVSDTGVGMDKLTLDRIFEPFFTTKAEGKGTGLGLAIVQGFIQQCNGHIWAYSEPGRGTSIKLYLPARINPTARNAERVSAESYAVNGSEVILLMEDDEALRQTLAAALESNGYMVLRAGTAAEAEELHQLHGDSIRLALTDIMLGDSTGVAVAAGLANRNPKLKIIYMSGYTESFFHDEAALEDDFILIRKPAMMRDVLQTVRAVLDGRMNKGVI